MYEQFMFLKLYTTSPELSEKMIEQVGINFFPNRLDADDEHIPIIV